MTYCKTYTTEAVEIAESVNTAEVAMQALALFGWGAFLIAAAIVLVEYINKNKI